jgi:uncharacterized protein YndB with AHSA1/START domain
VFVFFYILIFVLIVLIAIAAYATLQPSEMFISRELIVNAPPEKIFEYINNSKKANEWMPWKESDPGLVMNYSGPEAGVNSKSYWDSKGRMGTGEALVVESILNQTVKTQLTYIRPMTMSQLAEVSLHPTNAGTIVRWSVTGKNSFIGRFFCLFMNMDKMVGDQFLSGLNNLKKIIESDKTNA